MRTWNQKDGGEVEFVVLGIGESPRGGYRPGRDRIVAYRGLGRWDLPMLRALELEKRGFQREPVPEWEGEDTEDGSPQFLSRGSGAVTAARAYVAGFDGSYLPAHAPREYELVATVRIGDDEEAAHVIERARRAALELYGLACEPRLYGIDVLEWPSTWSVMDWSMEWSDEPETLNEHVLAADRETAMAVWGRYLKAKDPDFGSVDMYRSMWVMGCGGVGTIRC